MLGAAVVGDKVGVAVGAYEGLCVGESVGEMLGAAVVGDNVGVAVGAYEGLDVG